MGKMDSEFFDNKKGKMKELEMVLEDGEDIMESIKTAMIQNNISKGEIVRFEGKIKDANITYFQKSVLKNVEFDDPKEVVRANGEIKIDYSDNNRLFGRIRLIYMDSGKSFEGMMQRAKASGDFIIAIKYFQG